MCLDQKRDRLRIGMNKQICCFYERQILLERFMIRDSFLSCSSETSVTNYKFQIFMDIITAMFLY